VIAIVYWFSYLSAKNRRKETSQQEASQA